MQEYGLDNIRNVVLMSHGGAGKTSIAEAILFNTKAITRLGKVEEGTATSDYDPDEVKRKISINLSLLPHTEEDLVYLNDVLGRGTLTVLSRGYGNCRIMATATRNVWWVQFYNSQDAMILNTIEITPVPEVACASPEDIADSATRLDEILEIYR